MSAGNSEYVTESGRRDSAYSPQHMQGPSLALLESHDARSTIEDWSHDQDTAGPKFAVQAYTFPDGPASIPRSLPPPDCDTMAVLSLQTFSDLGSRYAESVPSLVSSRASAASKLSLQSSVAGSIGQIYRLDQDGDHDGHPQTGPPSVSSLSPAVQHPGGRPCLFSFLGCSVSNFTSAEHWYEHSKTHFRGNSPPKALKCPYPSCAWSITRKKGEDAWAERWEHLEAEHDVLVDAENLYEKRDARLYEHLWSIRVISDAQLQELRPSGQLGSNRLPYVTTERARPPRRQGKPPPSSRPGD